MMYEVIITGIAVVAANIKGSKYPNGETTHTGTIMPKNKIALVGQKAIVRIAPNKNAPILP